MTEHLFGLPHAYPDFPLQLRTSKSPKSPESHPPPALPPYEPTRTRDRIPPPMRGLNQVRFRQFKKQIENIRKFSFDLPKKETLAKSTSNLAERIRNLREDSTEKVTTGPRNDLHRQLVGMLKALEGAKGCLNTNFQIVSGESGDGRGGQDGVCPLCKCGCKATTKKISAPALISDPTMTEIRMEHKSYAQECLHCNSRFLHESPSSDFLCPSCKSGHSPSFPGALSLLLDLHIEEQANPPRSRTPTPPPLDRPVRSPGASRSPPSDTDRSPRKRLIISPTRRIVSIYRRSDDIRPQQSKLSLSIAGVPIRLVPGDQWVRVTVAEKFALGERREERKEAPIPPATPSFHSGPMVFSVGGESDLRCEQKTDVLDVSFSQNFLAESPEADLSLSDLCKSLHTEIEYVLSDHLQIASRHQYVFEVADISESYVVQYLNLIRRLWKILMPAFPEAVSALEMCIKGLVLVLETAITAGQKSEGPQKRHVDVSDKLQKALAELAEERKKTEKLDKSLKNVIRNYEEMIAMYTRDQMETVGFAVKNSRPDSFALED